ncbi:MAG: adenosylcobinamide-GDP ribazoletransferase [Alcanivorax sp.]|nr:adenosylcobinamide-GDP ribazoletransferase [Alcanivorax sp.]
MSWRGFLLAMVFLTRLPLRIAAPVTPQDQGHAVAAYPLVGLLIGLLLWGLGCLALLAGLPAWPVAVLLVILWVALTGALHLDGLADSADAWLGGQGDKARTLAIMKDPACGPAGVLALVLIVLAKTVALGTLLSLGNNAFALLPLLLAPLLGRMACSALFMTLPYVRANGLGSDAAAQLHGPTVRVMILLAAVAAPLLAGVTGLWLLLVAVLVILAGRRLMRQRLDGFTGDTAGALVETTEAAVLLSAALLL